MGPGNAASTLRGPLPTPDGSYGRRPSARTKGSILNTGLGLVPYRLLCNDVQREGVKPSPELASGLFCYVPLHKIGYSIHFIQIKKLSIRYIVLAS